MIFCGYRGDLLKLKKRERMENFSHMLEKEKNTGKTKLKS